MRATGANNTVIVGGLNYAYDLSGVASYAITGFNIVYNTHPYNFGGKQVTPQMLLEIKIFSLLIGQLDLDFFLILIQLLQPNLEITIVPQGNFFST